MNPVKEEAKRLIERLPEHVTWDDIMYEFYVRKKIDSAIQAAEESKIIPYDDVKKRFLQST